MAYTKTNWVNGTTPLSSDNMNKIEQGIYDAHDALIGIISITKKTMESAEAVTVAAGDYGTVKFKPGDNCFGNGYYIIPAEINLVDSSTTQDAEVTIAGIWHTTPHQVSEGGGTTTMVHGSMDVTVFNGTENSITIGTGSRMIAYVFHDPSN